MAFHQSAEVGSGRHENTLKLLFDRNTIQERTLKDDFVTPAVRWRAIKISSEVGGVELSANRSICFMPYGSA
jgi:hypothetical protein